MDVKIDYSIISRGTEKYVNHGYMAISEIVESYRYILNVDHNIKKVTVIDNYLKAKSCYEIDNIVFSRFQLITSLMFSKHKSEIKDGVFIAGVGNVGITCLMYLLDQKFKNITIYVKKVTKKIIDLSRIIYNSYNVEINFTDDLNINTYFNTYIDTTGDSFVINKIFDKSNFNNTIIILSTPRDDKYLISPLLINRKNLVVIGGHELNGVTVQDRQKAFENLLIANANKHFLRKFINIYGFSLEKLKKIKTKKSNFIEMFKY